MTVSPSAPGCAGGRRFGRVHESHTNLVESSSGCFVFGSALIELTTSAGVTLRVLTRLSASYRGLVSSGSSNAAPRNERKHKAADAPAFLTLFKFLLPSAVKYCFQSSLCWFGNRLSPL